MGGWVDDKNDGRWSQKQSLESSTAVVLGSGREEIDLRGGGGGDGPFGGWDTAVETSALRRNQLSPRRLETAMNRLMPWQG